MIQDTKKDKKIYPRILAAAVLLILSAALMILAAQAPDFAEWYSEHIYPVFVGSLGRIWGVFPFSVSEICLYLLLAALIVSLCVLAVRVVRALAGKGVLSEENISAETRGTEKGLRSAAVIRAVTAWVSGILLAAGILAFLYTVCCGINYHRRSFSEEEGIITYNYTAEELKEVCLWMTEGVNSLADEVSRDENGVMRLDAPEGEGAVDAMYSLAEEFSALEGYYPQPKKIIVSEILSYQSLTGVYSPFTVEANYNGDMTAYNIPFTTCHELSHLRGFMQEQEANFIAFLACIGSDRTDFQYSGYLSGWVYCMNALYRADYESWQEVRALLDTAADPDLAANNAFWAAYRGPVSETARRVNDTYLKANGQADGVQSYDRMVDLIVAYFNN